MLEEEAYILFSRFLRGDRGRFLHLSALGSKFDLLIEGLEDSVRRRRTTGRSSTASIHQPNRVECAGRVESLAGRLALHGVHRGPIAGA